MAEIKKLNVARGAVKRKLIAFQKFVYECTNTDLSQLQERYEKATNIWKEFEHIQLEIELKCEDEDTSKLAELYANGEKYEQIYYETMGLARQKLSANQAQQNDIQQLQAQVQTLAGNMQNQVNLSATDTLKVKLPTLTIHPFSGEYDKWLVFKDAYTEGVHNKNIPSVQKFQLLRSLLKDNALRIISSLEATEANYDKAWTLIKNRYENKRLIVNVHIKALMEMTPIVKANHMYLRNMVDELRSHLRALESMQQPVNHWDTIILHVMTNKLDVTTREEWEKEVGMKNTQDMSTIEEFLVFLEKRCIMLEMIDRGKNKQEAGHMQQSKKFDKKISMASTVTMCVVCHGQHMIFHCEKFLKMNPGDRYAELKKHRLCTNCLRPGHFSKDCGSSLCKKCNGRHHTLIHYDKKRTDSPQIQDQSTDSKTISKTYETPIVSHCIPRGETHIMLSTAQVYVTDVNGNLHKCRALLDPGSQTNMMTEKLASKLKLPFKRVNQPISAVSRSLIRIEKSILVKITSTASRFTIHQNCLVLPTITEDLPQIRLDKTKIHIPEGLELADPEFDKPACIDLLLGAGPFWKILIYGEALKRRNQPVLQNTQLGWIFGGEFSNQNEKNLPVCNLLTSLEAQIERFWQIDELNAESPKREQEEFCERHFKETYTRHQDGRFEVELPKKSDVLLGDSFEKAMKRLNYIERRFASDKVLKQEYIKFLDDYEITGHMSLYEGIHNQNEEHFYLPHHPVIRTSSLTTKLRVVFDGSSKSSFGTALNDKLLTGPNLQSDINQLLIRFRLHQYVLTADISQMFRQIMVKKTDRNLQRILWRTEPKKPVQIYTLNTVTYGTNCAPFLAMRCLKELATLEKDEFPRASEVLQNDFYMDDLITGTNSIEEAVTLHTQLYELLAKGRFHLRKWRSNDPVIIKQFKSGNKTEDPLFINSQDTCKTLGLIWNSEQDILQYQISLPDLNKVTKRKILSVIAQIFDPLGCVGPIVMEAKLLMQELWKSKLGWDDEVSSDTYNNWNLFCKSLSKLGCLEIPRNVNPGNFDKKIIIHGFCDASTKGYGACVYIISLNNNGVQQANFLCSKSRVAPLKQLTMPRLELNAALLLSKLINLVEESLNETIQERHLWTDSTIVLQWIKSSPSDLQVYVSNRVRQIQDLTQECFWHHVPTKDNPADILSRGATTMKLMTYDLWWHGPTWICSHMNWPRQDFYTTNQDIEFKTVSAVSTIKPVYEILSKYSSFLKLQRIIAYCFRFIDNTRKKKNGAIQNGSLTVKELDESLQRILRLTQEEAFNNEISCLKRNKVVDPTSKLLSLNPFMDDNNLIRVGGRIRNADIPEDQKFPIVLPSRHHVTKLLLRQEHWRLKHCGPQQLLFSIRLKYWPLSGMREARKVTRSCISCFRYKPVAKEHKMGDLPISRVTVSSRPFETCGVDYAGPVEVRESRRRGRIYTSKGYIAIFTCFTTRATHIELVSSLTTEGFMAALRRFAARRGMSTTIYSDNAKNFVGASRELREMYDFLTQNYQDIVEQLAIQKVEWKFIPPRSPHFGGIWESAVKMVKKHLQAVIGSTKCTFEEYATILSEIESVLNSRPLTAMSSDPHDYTALTASHFLIGDVISEPASKNYIRLSDSHLSRWEFIQKLKQQFWVRWKREYLNQLQARSKWKTDADNLQENTLVLMIDDNQSSLYWPLGRVVRVFPGKDGVSRVAEVKTVQGIFKRCVRKLCPLPLDL